MSDCLASMGVQGLRLLQQDVLHQPCDVHIDVACEVVQAGSVGSDPLQQVRGACDLLRGLVVVDHFHDDPAETC